MITRIDPTFDRIEIVLDLEEADAILRALYAGTDRVPKDRRAIVGELREALFAFKYPTTKEETP